MLLRALVLLCLLASPALAQTTFSSDCTAGITITGGGLTLTGTLSNTRVVCRAGNPKYSGKWYFTFTPSGTVTSPQIGLASGPTVVGTIPPTGTGRGIGADLFGVSYSTASGAGSLLYNGATAIGGIGPLASGVTAAVAINLDTNPNQIWVTPDITGTSGFGGGPLWNNVNTSSPEVPGSGAIITGNTGSLFFLPGELYYPAFSSLTLDAGTFSFASNTTLESKIGAGQTVVYQNWNAATGGPPTPGPLSPQTYIVANVPPWAASTSVSTGARRLAGPGHTPGGGFTNGAALYVWGLSGAGGTTGASQPAGFGSCATPANAGGGLNGTPPSAWAGATTVSDNGLTWVCLSKVDYVTVTDMMQDDLPWTPGIPYYQLSFTVNGNNFYVNGSVFGGGDCVSASSGGPTGTGSNITDGSCSWNYAGTRAYTSGVAPWTHQLNPSAGFAQLTYSFYPTITVYYGGSDRQVYQGGQNGEANPIPFYSHQDFLQDAAPSCRHAYNIAHVYDAASCNGSPTVLNFPSGDWGWILQAAPGDSIGENIDPATTPLRVDQTKGLTFYSNSVGNTGNGQGDALAFSDSYGYVKGLQLHTTQWLAIDAHTFALPGYQHTNGVALTNSIVQADAGPGIATIDAGWAFANDVLIYGGSTTGAYGVASAYFTYFQNVTLIGTSGLTNSTGVIQQADLQPGLGDVFNSVAMFGWTNPLGFSTGTTYNASGANNATDVTSGFAGSTYSTATPGFTVNSFQIPGPGTTCSGGAGTCLGLSASNQFVNPAIGASLDLRIKSTSADIYGAGAASTLNNISNALDLNGTTRGPRYDLGPEQFHGAPPPPSLLIGPGRLF